MSCNSKKIIETLDVFLQNNTYMTASGDAEVYCDGTIIDYKTFWASGVEKGSEVKKLPSDQELDSMVRNLLSIKN